MSEISKIEWTDATWNPIVGCDPISLGCDNCYAAKEANKLQHNPATPQYQGLVKMKDGSPAYNGTVRFVESQLDKPLHWKKPRRIFVCSMGDLFHRHAPDEWRDKVFAVMALCPQHTFIVLTKRVQKMHRYMTGFTIESQINMAAWKINGFARDVHWPLPNVWLGTTCENQAQADKRIPYLLDTPAAARFVSVEPMLGPVDLNKIVSDSAREPSKTCGTPWGHSISALHGTVSDGPGGPRFGRVEYETLGWVICGGESGPGARPMHPDWARGLRDQCSAASVPFFFKQWGEWKTVFDRDKDDPDCRDLPIPKRNERWMNLAGGHGFHGDRVVLIWRVGKKAAGRLLDGREWNQIPGGD